MLFVICFLNAVFQPESLAEFLCTCVMNVHIPNCSAEQQWEYFHIISRLEVCFAYDKFRMDFNQNKWFWLFISVYGNVLYWICKKKDCKSLKQLT